MASPAPRIGGRPTLEDLARAAGVSRTTASNAFNRPDQLSARLRERVLGIARDIGYGGPSPAGRMLRTGRAGAIALVFADTLGYAFDDPVSLELLKGVADECEATSTGLLLLPSANDVGADAVQHAAVDGFMVYCLSNASSTIARVLGRGVPVVTIDQGLRQGELASVGIDDRRAARRAAEHLLGLGHRRFGVVTFELRPDGHSGRVTPERLRMADFTPSCERLLGYADALHAAGIDPATVPIEERPGNTESVGAEAARALLGSTPRPTALLATSDRLALGVMAAAREPGLRVPADLSVVGFDDIAAAATSDPPLTTIRQPLRAKGEAAARRLLAPRQTRRHQILPTELVVRGSTAPSSAYRKL